MKCSMENKIIFHICRSDEWHSAIERGMYSGSSQDKKDGYIHFSASNQVIESAAKHRAGQKGLVLLTVDGDLLEPSLKWEAARGGELFPHLYGDLPINAVLRAEELPLGPDGLHIFPKLDIST